MKRLRVILADDHKIFLEGLKTLLEPKYEIADAVEDGEALVAAAQQLEPDLIVADISMPILNGIEAWRRIKELRIDTKMILLTMHDDAEYASQALKDGISGYVLKRAATSELLKAMDDVRSGDVYVTPMIGKQLIRSLGDGKYQARNSKTSLTTRQRQILGLLARGLVAKEIADRLDISPRTVEYHKYKMMEELDIRTTAELIRYSVKQELAS